MNTWTQLKNLVTGLVSRTLILYHRQQPCWLMRCLFVVNGIGLELKCGAFWRCVWNLHRAVVSVFLGIFTVDRLRATVASDAEFDERLFHLHLIFIAWVIVVRQLSLTSNLSSIVILRKYTMSNDFQRHDEECQRKRNNAWNYLKKVELALGVQGAVMFLVFTMFDVEKNFSLQFPLDLSDISDYLQIVCTRVYSLYYCWLCLAVVINWYSIIAPMMCFVTELDIIGDAFGRVLEESLQPGQEYRFDLTNHQIVKFWQTLEECIGRCCQQHVQFMQMLNVFKAMTSKLFLLVYGATITLTAFEIYQVVSTKRLGFYEILILQDSCIFYAEYFSFCWLATKMNTMNMRISDRIYGQEWYREMQYADGQPKLYRSVKQSLLVVMIFAQQPLGISVGGVYELSMELFVQLLDSSYSLLMFLRKLT